MRNPTPAEIKAARENIGITQRKAAEMLRTEVRTWQKWEYGEAKMHPAFWELFLRKTEQLGD